ncbi:hypothetical protein ACFV16_38285 [Streptomyces massasporeus]|uniref:hypothetical protein n=1 Tax=Streptomyces massasporeus TaxID=67324 RepID=UPI0036B3474D
MGNAMKDLPPARSRRRRLATVTLLTSCLLTLLPSTSAFAAQEDTRDGGATSKGYPHIVPWEPRIDIDCNTHNINDESDFAWLNFWTDMNEPNPWGYQSAYPRCDLQLAAKTPFPANPYVYTDYPGRQVSQTIDNCNNSQAATITQGFTTTVTNTVTDVYGVHISLNPGFDFSDKLTGAVNAAFDYQHTVASGNATATYTAYTLGVAPYKKGYLEFAPKLSYSEGTLTATYLRNTHGKKVWSKYVKNTAPVYIPGTQTADGSWRIHYLPC